VGFQGSGLAGGHGGAKARRNDHRAGPLAISHQLASHLLVVRRLQVQVLCLRQHLQHHGGHLAPVVVHHQQVNHHRFASPAQATENQPADERHPQGQDDHPDGGHPVLAQQQQFVPGDV